MAILSEEFEALKERIRRFKEDVPPMIAAATVKHFLENFDKEGFESNKWKEVQRRTPGTKAYKYPKTKDLGRRTRPILIGKGSGKLRKAVNSSVRVQSWPIIRLVVDLPYASVHNEGAPSKNIPKRQFMGQSDELTKIQKQIFERELNTALGGI